ncbi:hypothetical protein PLICRDRAFT_596736 [Plicaturopsis crispa FD-325 SS-3]|nr:hypothetical protein PLICRDRAFT_596736 [Plicaturopsis crispa FD-325 SS-3]
MHLRDTPALFFRAAASSVNGKFYATHVSLQFWREEIAGQWHRGWASRSPYLRIRTLPLPINQRATSDNGKYTKSRAGSGIQINEKGRVSARPVPISVHPPCAGTPLNLPLKFHNKWNANVSGLMRCSHTHISSRRESHPAVLAINALCGVCVSEP